MKRFLLKGQENKVYDYQPIGEVYQLEGESVMDCAVYDYVGSGEGYGRYRGQIPMTLATIQNKDGSHV